MAENPFKSPRKLISKQLGYLALILFVAFFSALILAFPVKWVWNWLIPELFNGPIISALQAWGIMFLSQLLFARGQINTNTPAKPEPPQQMVTTSPRHNYPKEM